MTNPEIFITAINDTTATLIFKGAGRVTISNFSLTGSGQFSIGPNSVLYNNNATNFPIMDYIFAVDAEIYAIADSGVTGSVKVVRWF